MRVRVAMTIGVLAGVTAAGCASAAQSDDRGAATSRTWVTQSRAAVQTLTCGNSLGSPRTPGSGRFDAVAGPIRFISALRVAQHPHRHFERSRGRDFMLKSPLIVEPGERVRVLVPRTDRAHVSLAYTPATSRRARVAGGAAELDISSCPDPAETGWRGAIIVNGARCVRLVVVRGETSTMLRIPFGRGTCRND